MKRYSFDVCLLCSYVIISFVMLLFLQDTKILVWGYTPVHTSPNLIQYLLYVCLMNIGAATWVITVFDTSQVFFQNTFTFVFILQDQKRSIYSLNRDIWSSKRREMLETEVPGWHSKRSFDCFQVLSKIDFSLAALTGAKEQDCRPSRISLEATQNISGGLWWYRRQ